jgi:hypothetical protein
MEQTIIIRHVSCRQKQLYGAIIEAAPPDQDIDFVMSHGVVECTHPRKQNNVKMGASFAAHQNSAVCADFARRIYLPDRCPCPCPGYSTSESANQSRTTRKWAEVARLLASKQ